MFELRKALPSDAPSIASCVCEAYLHYIERIGKQPGPMLMDYDQILRDTTVHVVTSDSGRIIGVVVLQETAEGFYIDNVAVRPAVKGRGVGRQLLQLAEQEARRLGYDTIYLATHELMIENRALYERIGYRQFDQRVVSGYPRVLLRKRLATD